MYLRYLGGHAAILVSTNSFWACINSTNRSKATLVMISISSLLSLDNSPLCPAGIGCGEGSGTRTRWRLVVAVAEMRNCSGDMAKSLLRRSPDHTQGSGGFGAGIVLGPYFFRPCHGCTIWAFSL